MKKKTKVKSDNIRNFFGWVEGFSGCSYDVSDDLDRLKDTNRLYFNPVEWYCEIIGVVEMLEEVDDILKRSVFYPDDGSLPSRKEMSKEYAEWVEDELCTIIDEVKRQLHMQSYNYNNSDDLIRDVQIIRDIVALVNENSMESIISRGLIDNYDKLHGYMLSEQLGIRQKTFSSVYNTVKELRELYIETNVE